ARARRGEAQASRLISRRRASKRRHLGARPSPGIGRFGRAPGLNQATIALSLSWNDGFRQGVGTGERGGGNGPSSESGETCGAMSRSSIAAMTTRGDDDGSSLSIARALSLSWNVRFRQGGGRGLWKLAKRGTERGLVHSSTVNE
ncbi:hypothetical protein BHE74_00056156, partial [Ensete ventricosum]